MASITAADIKRLREATGAGMTDVKKRLVEADGDYDKAVEQLRIKGLKGVAKREGRAASNGLVIAKLEGTTKGTLLELNCETDFVAKSAKFTELAQSVADAAFGINDATALQSVEVDGKPLRDVLDDAERRHGREDRGPPRRDLRGRLRRELPAPHRPRPAAAAGRARRALRGDAAGRQGRRAAHRRVLPDLRLRAPRSPRTSSPRSARSPRPRPRRRASPRRPCRRSSRVASTASSRSRSCSSRPSPRTTRRRSARSSTRPACS
jgi:hypothetical protein